MTYQETRNNFQAPKVQKILLVSTGTSGTNFFFEMLSEELNNKLKFKGIQTVYYHLGNNKDLADKSYREIIQNADYDVVLQFAQMDETRNPIFASTGSGTVPLANGSANYSYNTRSVRFQQMFMVKYFDFQNLSNSAIDANLTICLDFLNPNEYNKLTGIIINSLKIGP
jgi:hypothetical protein